MNQTIAEAIDATRKNICAEDEIYQQDEKDVDELTKRFMDLDLPEYDRMIIDDYIACLQTVDCRYADISYMAGVNTDDLEHSARSFRADLPPFQSNLSALLSTPSGKAVHTFPETSAMIDLVFRRNLYSVLCKSCF